MDFVVSVPTIVLVVDASSLTVVAALDGAVVTAGINSEVDVAARLRAATMVAVEALAWLKRARVVFEILGT